MSNYLASSKTGSQKSVYPGPGLALPIRPYVNTTATAYTRPSDWLTIPSLTAGVDKKIYILAAIFNDTSNQFALYVTGSAGYTVDWGDGLGSVNYASGVNASYNIAWSNISSSTLTTRGYRQALITITPQSSGTLTALNINVKNASNTTAGVPANCWLEVAICSAAMTAINIGGTAAYASMLEKVNFVETGTVTTAANMFQNCWSLQSVNAPTLNSTQSASGMFQACYSLRTAPTLSTLTAPSDLSNLFQNCYSLIDPGSFTHMTTNGCTTLQMFDACYSLVTAPAFGANFRSNVVTSMFRNCYALRNVPSYDLTLITVLNTMFQNCYSLKTAPFLKLPPAAGSAIYSANSTFNNCYNLTTVPAYDWSAVSTLSNTFAGCTALESFPPITATYCTTMTSLFNACRALKTVGTITTGATLTDLSNAFLNCQYLDSGPIITNITSVTSIASMYSGCYNLKYVPDMALGNVTTMASAFNSCGSLTTAPNITMNASSSLTSTDSMFAVCRALTSVPNYSFSWAAAGTTVNLMFQNCSALQVAPNIANMNKIITVSSMYSGCSALRECPAYDLTVATTVANMFTSCPTLQQAPAFTNTSAITTVNAMFSGCGSLENLPAYNLTGVSSAANYTSFVLNCGNLARSQITNVKYSHSYINCKLSGTQLDEIYTNLPTITAQTITVTNNWGTATDTPSIATAKGWTVTGT